MTGKARIPALETVKRRFPVWRDCVVRIPGLKRV